jgi:hypothetical protein
MQILEIGNNFSPKIFKFTLVFYHICFLYFVNFRKIKIFDAHLYNFDEI